MFKCVNGDFAHLYNRLTSRAQRKAAPFTTTSENASKPNAPEHSAYSVHFALDPRPCNAPTRAIRVILLTLRCSGSRPFRHPLYTLSSVVLAQPMYAQSRLLRPVSAPRPDVVSPRRPALPTPVAPESSHATSCATKPVIRLTPRIPTRTCMFKYPIEILGSDWDQTNRHGLRFPSHPQPSQAGTVTKSEIGGEKDESEIPENCS